jgi:aminomethyltransferase
MMQTPLYQKHIILNARMVDFTGYQMPIQYSGIIQEHLAVRNSCGIFDVCHMGELIVSGVGAEDLLNYITVNDVKSMSVGDAQYSAMCYENGGIIDDILIYKYADKYMLVVNSSNLEKDFSWLKKYKRDDVELIDISAETGLIALQGPDSRNILQKCVELDLTDIPFYTFIENNIGGFNATFARTGYTGELGFEIYADKDDIGQIWDIIMDSGDVTPCGLACRDTLRMEMKFCLYGNDIDDATNPIEAGLGWITKLNKDKFIGKNSLLLAKENRIRYLTAFKMDERAVPRKGYSIYADGNKVGKVTSGTQSPSLQKGIGLGYVQFGKHKVGMELDLDIRGIMKKATIIKPPFYKNGSSQL